MREIYYIPFKVCRGEIHIMIRLGTVCLCGRLTGQFDLSICRIVVCAVYTLVRNCSILVKKCSKTAQNRLIYILGVVYNVERMETL